MKKEMCEYTHNDYNKITFCMMWLGARLRLNLNTRLWSSGSNGTDYNYHSEFMYLSGKVPRINISLTPHIYFSIDPIDSSLKKDMSVRINTIDIPNMNKMAEKILEVAKNIVYASNNMDIEAVYEKIKNFHCVVSLYSGNCILEIEPTLSYTGVARNASIGFNIILNGTDELFYIDINTAINMATIFSQPVTYMLLMGQMLLLNLNAPYGTNLKEYGFSRGY